MRRLIGSALESLHLLRISRCFFRKLTGHWKNFIWSMKKHEKLAPDGIPLPSPRLCFPVTVSYDPNHYYSSGEIGSASIRHILEQNDKKIESMERILDFGCGCGRLTRHLNNLSGLEIHGTDSSKELINWCIRNLSFGCFTTHKLESKLVYADNYFDFAYSVAVFGHFTEDLQKHWINELCRVIKPGGLLLVTVKGSNRTDELTESEEIEFNKGNMVVKEPEYSGTIYCLAYNPESHFRTILSSEMKVLTFLASGSPDTFQDVYLLQKAQSLDTR